MVWNDKRYAKKFPFHSLSPVRFISPLPRGTLRNDDTPRKIKDNNDFPIYYALPQDAKKKNRRTKHLIIMINGFDEKPAGQRLYYGRPNSLSQLLQHTETEKTRKADVTGRFASVLLPIPFHHWRRPTYRPYDLLDPAHMIEENKIRLYLGFQQLMLDLNKLVNDVLQRRKRIYADHFDESLRIHLVGYSLGGLAALSFFLLDSLLNPDRRVSTCTLLASGVSLQNASFRLTDLSPVQVAAIRKYYNGDEWLSEREAFALDSKIVRSEFALDSKKVDVDALIQDLFMSIVLDDGSGEGSRVPEIQEKWVAQASNILYITGEKDDIMKQQHLYRRLPDGALQLHHTAVGVGHILHADRNWLGGEARKAVEWALDILIRD